MAPIFPQCLLFCTAHCRTTLRAACGRAAYCTTGRGRQIWNNCLVEPPGPRFPVVSHRLSGTANCGAAAQRRTAGRICHWLFCFVSSFDIGAGAAVLLRFFGAEYYALRSGSCARRSVRLRGEWRGEGGGFWVLGLVLRSVPSRARSCLGSHGDTLGTMITARRTPSGQSRPAAAAPRWLPYSLAILERCVSPPPRASRKASRPGRLQPALRRRARLSGGRPTLQFAGAKRLARGGARVRPGRPSRVAVRVRAHSDEAMNIDAFATRNTVFESHKRLSHPAF